MWKAHREGREGVFQTVLLILKNYDSGCGLFLYQGVLKDALMGLKFHERKEYGEFLETLCVGMERIYSPGAAGGDRSRSHSQKRNGRSEDIIRQNCWQIKSAAGFLYPFGPIWCCAKNSQKHRKN